MHTVLTHLLDNACIAAAGTSEAVVVVAHELHETSPGTICIEISDRGPGIPADLREKIFLPFFSSRTDGTGLGLAIVRQIMENHHGTIEIDSADTQGCTVRLHLPLPQMVTP
jgi:two-component system sensor histidine kinase PilS (NtrC family)